MYDDDSDEMRIYIDGQLNAKKTGVTSGPLVTNGELRLGLSHYVFFKGIIDEVKVTADESYFLDDDVYMHGKHSWQVTGGSSDDLVVGQTLSSEVVEYIRQRQTVQNRGASASGTDLTAWTAKTAKRTRPRQKSTTTIALGTRRPAPQLT